MKNFRFEETVILFAGRRLLVSTYPPLPALLALNISVSDDFRNGGRERKAGANPNDVYTYADG